MKFQPAIQFPVLLEGKAALAQVLEEIDHPVHTIFHVLFSDGYEDQFLLEDDGNVFGSGISAIPYAKAIRFDIGHLVGIDPSRFYYSYPEIIDGMTTNVWVMEGEDEAHEIIYKVYYFEFFRFALRREGNHWKVSHTPRYGRIPEGEIVKKVGFLLDSLLEESR